MDFEEQPVIQSSGRIRCKPISELIPAYKNEEEIEDSQWIDFKEEENEEQTEDAEWIDVPENANAPTNDEQQILQVEVEKGGSVEDALMEDMSLESSTSTNKEQTEDAEWIDVPENANAPTNDEQQILQVEVEKGGSAEDALMEDISFESPTSTNAATNAEQQVLHVGVEGDGCVEDALMEDISFESFTSTMIPLAQSTPLPTQNVRRSLRTPSAAKNLNSAELTFLRNYLLKPFLKNESRMTKQKIQKTKVKKQADGEACTKMRRTKPGYTALLQHFSKDMLKRQQTSSALAANATLRRSSNSQENTTEENQNFITILLDKFKAHLQAEPNLPKPKALISSSSQNDADAFNCTKISELEIETLGDLVVGYYPENKTTSYIYLHPGQKKRSKKLQKNNVTLNVLVGKLTAKVNGQSRIASAAAPSLSLQKGDTYSLSNYPDSEALIMAVSFPG